MKMLCITCDKKKRKLFLDCLGPEDGGSTFLQNVITYPSTWFHIPKGLNVYVETAKRYVKNLITKTFSTVPMRQFILVPCNKRAKTNCWESFFMHVFQKQNVPIDEQRVNDLNPMYKLAQHVALHT